MLLLMARLSESSVRSDLLFNDEDGVTCLTNDEIFENLSLMGYEQLSTKLTFQKGNRYRWQSQAPRNHGGTPAQNRSDRLLEQSNEPTLSEGGYTPGSDEGRMKLDELITLCTKLSKQVLDLEKEKDAQAVEILNLKQRTSSDDGLDEEDASKQGRRSDKIKPIFIDKDFEELDDHMENVKEETVDAAIICDNHDMSRSEFGISSWRGSRVDGRSYLLSGAIDGSEANRIIRDSKSCKVRVGSNGNLLWEASVLLGGVRVAREDDRGVTEGREDVHEVFQQRRSRAKRKLSRCGRNQLGDEPILALPEGADDFIVYYDARSKDLEACLEKRRSEFDFLRPRPSGKGNVDVCNRGIGKKKEARMSRFTTIRSRFEKRMLVSGSYWLNKVWTSIWRDVKTLAIEEAYMTKYSIHPGADTVTVLWAVTGESKLNGSNLVHETTNKIAVIQERLEAAKLSKELPCSVENFCLVSRVSEIGLGGAESLSKPEIAWIL
ncbi:hypothetical protein Tco_0044455 [Tanacetum coccineum]